MISFIPALGDDIPSMVALCGWLAASRYHPNFTNARPSQRVAKSSLWDWFASRDTDRGGVTCIHIYMGMAWHGYGSKSFPKWMFTLLETNMDPGCPARKLISVRLTLPGVCFWLVGWPREGENHGTCIDPQQEALQEDIMRQWIQPMDSANGIVGDYF